VGHGIVLDDIHPQKVSVSLELTRILTVRANSVVRSDVYFERI